MANLPHWRRMWTLNEVAVSQGLPAPYHLGKLWRLMYEEESDKAGANAWWECPPDGFLWDVFTAVYRDWSHNWWCDSESDAEVSVVDMRVLADK